MGCCKIELVPLRVMLFTFYGGISCVLPFLSLHMSTLGLSADERSWLHFVLPFALCAAPLLGGALADRLGNYKPLLVVSLLISAAAYPCLLLVPRVVRRPARAPELFLRCDGRGSLVGTERCAAGCRLGDAVVRPYHLHDCQFRCQVGAARPPPPPHLCLEGAGRGRTTQCEVLDDGAALVVNASLPRLMQREGEHTCWYPLVDFSRAGARHRSLVCPQAAGCPLRCRLRQASERPLFADSLCREPIGQPTRTLWLYFAVRAVTETFLALAVVLVNASTLLLRRRHRSDFGCEWLWALLGLAAFAPVCGLLLDWQRASDGRPDLQPSLFAFSALMLLSAVLASIVPVRPVPAAGARPYPRQLAKTIFSCEFFGVMCALTILGALWGFLETYLFGHVRAMGGSQLQAGLSLSIGALLMMPLLLKAEAVINFCGHHHVLIVAFIIYIVRYVSYAYIVSPWLVLVAESLEMVTLHLAWMGAVLFTTAHGRPVVEATLQGVITAAHYGLGRGLGAGVVRYVLPLTSGYLLLCAGSVLSAVVAALYLLLCHCSRALRPDRRRRRHKTLMYSSEGALLNGTSPPPSLQLSRM